MIKRIKITKEGVQVMGQRLKGKVAVITGSGGGIGRAAALLMVSEGAKVVINDFGKDANGVKLADKVVKEIKDAGGEAAANYDSVATMAGGESIINAAIKNFGRVDILVNNAGNWISMPTVEMTEAQWDSIINVHLKGHFACTKPAIKEMIKQKSGRIVNISSIGAAMGADVVYSTAKAGVLGFTTALSNELKEYGITVNAVLPNARTSLFPKEVSPMDGKKRPDPESVAPIIVFLTTDDAKDITNRFITGGGAFYLGGDENICIFPRILQIPGGAPVLVAHTGVWTLDELVRIIPPLLRFS
jgi:NAD(P)-dependent dehydrogenase (short-subunit alcohol dehydrogenase family)